ncbi:metallophosphoesterase [Blastococcus brunescens]|uniref:Metallophosphoesterase n=1 Tax=Blastococcus brunescens TaxID=1564165 RepID=A0ABZ1B9A8_9ACTN|nr:metallophosphoesterase [Blastococcus sp. BMG 8361]WRL66271.1 metallophosphoesterase [Blastococcus sp. BMG 8361]
MRRWLGRAAVALGALLALLAVYGVLVEPRLLLEEERSEVALPGLRAGAVELEVAVLSDMQIGMWWANTGMVEKAVERAVDRRPDVVLLGGDFVYSTDPDIDTQVDNVLELLDPLIEAEIPTVAVLGNHDYAVGAQRELTTALESQGIPVLLNESVPIPVPGGDGDRELYVVGLGPTVPDLADPDAALADVPPDAPRVVLMHNPTAFPELPPGSAPSPSPVTRTAARWRCPGPRTGPTWGSPMRRRSSRTDGGRRTTARRATGCS